MKICRSCLLIIAITISHWMAAQSGDITFKRYSVSDGLSDNYVRCVFIDSKGFLWVGTEEGLNRFDGEEFIAYKRNNAARYNICGNIVTDIIEDADGSLWIATRDGGICRLNPETGEVFSPKLLNTAGSTPQTFVHSIEFSSEGNLVVGTDKGIYVSKDRINFYEIKNGFRTSYDLEVHNNKIVVATVSGSIATIDNDSLIKLVETPKGFPFPGHSINDIYVDSENRCWIAAWDNFLHEYSASQERLLDYNFMNVKAIDYSGEEMRRITQVSKNKLWLVLKSGTIWEFDTNTHKSAPIAITSRENGRLFGRTITSLLTDDLGRIWVGTDNGLHMYNPNTSMFNVTELEKGSTVNGIAESGNDIFLATNKGILKTNNFKYEPTNWLYQNETPNSYSIASIDKENLVIGTNNILLQCNLSNPKLAPFINENIKDMDLNNIVSSRYTPILHSKENGQVISSAYGHGVVFTNDSDKRTTFVIPRNESGLENLVTSFCEGNDHIIYFGGALTGVTELKLPKEKFDNRTFFKPIMNMSFEVIGRNFTQGLLSKSISSIIRRDNDSFWVTTKGGGLHIFEPNNAGAPFQSIPSPRQTMKSVIQDFNNNLWIVASGILLHYNTSAGSWTEYNAAHGIPQSGLSGALYQLSSGEICAGGEDFIMKFSPDNMERSIEVPKTRIIHLKVMDVNSDSLLLMDNPKIPYNKNFIKIGFASLSYNNPTGIQFEYLLEGYDKKWNNNGTNNSVSYNNLPGGDYTFKVRALKSDGTPEQYIAAISFCILPPFYQRWWFIAGIAILMALILLAILRYRKNEKQKVEIMRNKIARDLHDDIGSALGSISFFSEAVKKKLKDNEDQSSYKVLEKIGNTSREMIDNMHDIIWAVNPAHDSFIHLKDKMRSLATDLSSANNLKLNFEYDETLSQTKLSMTERKNIFLIFKEALYNTCKYSKASEITIIARKNPQKKLFLSIHDNGIGISPAAQTRGGNGLKNMHVRAEEINGELTIASSAEIGTNIQLRF
jgi:ligand-binding sensor domain-containing protein